MSSADAVHEEGQSRTDILLSVFKKCFNFYLNLVLMFEDQFESSGSNNKQNPTTVDFHAA